jgi:hypothetical protein
MRLIDLLLLDAGAAVAALVGYRVWTLLTRKTQQPDAPRAAKPVSPHAKLHSLINLW